MLAGTAFSICLWICFCFPFEIAHAMPALLSMTTSPSRRPPAAIDIPFDVFCHIASFLSPEHRRNLYAVNHTFFTIAMNERYRDIHLGRDDGDKKISRDLSRLRHSPHGHRVHTLHLYPDSMAQYLSVKESNVLTTVLKRIRQTTNSPPIELDTGTTRVEALLQSIKGMSNVRGLVLCTPMRTWLPRSCDLEYLLRTVISSGRNTFGNSLRSLTLNLSPESYQYALTPSLLFPNLEDLSISLLNSPLPDATPTSWTDGRKLLRDILVPFINTHYFTLKSLTLVMAIFGTNDISTCLCNIHHLPHLQKLDYHYDFISSDNIDTSGLQHILQKHSNELQELTLSFGFPLSISSSEWYAQDCFRVALPCLRSLTLGDGCWWDVGLTAAWLQHFNKSLTCLTLDRCRFSYQQAETIIRAFARQELRTLHLSVHYLSPGLFEMLENNLPNLVHLRLRFADVSWKTEQQGRNEEILFCEAMRRCVYSKWKLRRLTAQFTGLTAKLKGDTLASYKAAISTALPTLQTLEVEQYNFKG